MYHLVHFISSENLKKSSIKSHVIGILRAIKAHLFAKTTYFSSIYMYILTYLHKYCNNEIQND